jgi:uncharacterized SAM-binding protein YcdF (DUF218 family)
MFIASKLLSFLLQPLAWVALLMLLSIAWLPRRPLAARRALWLALILGLLVGWLPLADALLRPLENRNPAPADAAAGRLQNYVGVVVLGGALEPGYVWGGHDQVALNGAAERMTVPVALLRQHAHLRLIFTGGDGELWPGDMSEAVRAQQFFTDMGVPAERVAYEDKSRTTYENAVLTAALPSVDKAQRWLLLTSAMHMPRSLAAFRAAGWNVTPYPVDYRTGTSTPWTEYSLAKGALRWQLLLHEYVGWFAYAVAGRA